MMDEQGGESGINPSTSSEYNDDIDEESPSPSMLCCAFNQDGGCLSIGTTDGFAIFNQSPHFSKSVDRPLPGGIGHIEMLFRCNLLALVGGGSSPYSPPHRVMIWDDHPQRIIGELSFRQAVLGVKLRRDAIAVALRDRVYVYHLSDLSLRAKIYTSDNPNGLLCLSNTVQDMVLACPSIIEGHVRVELYGLRKTVLIEAHESSLQSLALSADGVRLATASSKGTVIRVWDVASSSCVQEFRRGVERATIACLAWSFSGSYFACTSDKGTTHVFCLDASTEVKQKSISRRIYQKVKKSILEVGESQKKSICQIRGVPHPHSCAFLPDSPNRLAITGWDADGNGVLLISEFHTQKTEEEPKRVGYHVVARSFIHEDEQTKRRRRLLGATPSDLAKANASDPYIGEEPRGKIHVGERLEVLEGMNNIFLEDETESGFVSVTTVKPKEQSEESETNSDTLPIVTSEKIATTQTNGVHAESTQFEDQEPEMADAQETIQEEVD